MSAWKVASIVVTPPQTTSNASAINSYERCGEGFCLTVPTSIANSCGTWLTLQKHCCYTDAYNPKNITALGVQEGFFPCTSVPNIQDTPYDKFGTNTFYATGADPSCPEDSFAVAAGYDNSTPLTCCPSGGDERWGTLTLQAVSAGVPLLKCGDFNVFPTEEDLINSENILNQLDQGGGEDVAPGNVPTSTGNGGAIGTSTISGGATSTTSTRPRDAYGFADKKKVKKPFLIFGSLVVATYINWGL
ncbi:hypothetical protein TWF694_005118 [Orbilia ellipsospora]|uniref:Uncharacterized protein n=1 Tax=Orbilia ellipsospora TaxID=2528407 RepID=A0AAV9WUS9_9PEZI